MTRISRIVRALATVLLGLAAAPHAGAADLSGTLVVANRLQGAGSVSLFDLETGAEVGRLPIGPVIPHEVAVSPDGRRAVTAEYGTGQARGRRVVVIDIVNARIDGYIDLGPISRPHSVAFLPDGRRVVATMEDADRIALVDIDKLAVVRTYPTGGREGHMVRLSPDGAFAYVASRGGEGTLSVISLREDVPPVVIPTGRGAEGLAVSPDGTEVWVVNRADETMSVVNTATHEVTAVIPARLGAGRAEISAAGRVVVPNGAGALEVEKFLTVYDLGSRRVIGERRMAFGRGAYTIHIVREQAFVADRAEDSITIYDLPGLEEVGLLVPSHPSPDGMAYSPRRVAAMEDR